VQEVAQSISGLLLGSIEVVSMADLSKALLQYKKSWAWEQVLPNPATKIEDSIFFLWTTIEAGEPLTELFARHITTTQTKSNSRRDRQGT
jgi:hypothetical protein